MAQHNVSLETPELLLGKADVTFSIKKDGQQHGRLKISKGGINWTPKNNTYGYDISWSKLAELIETHGSRKK